ncbi:MAG: hypothetical protein ABSF85_08275 [Terriglobales bacterium]|jgi:hypothetical protein
MTRSPVKRSRRGSFDWAKPSKSLNYMLLGTPKALADAQFLANGEARVHAVMFGA